MRCTHSKGIGAALLSLALVLPARTALADVHGFTPVRPSPIYLTASAPAPRLLPFAPTPKPIVSEGAKAGLIAGGIVAAVLLVTGGIIVIRG